MKLIHVSIQGFGKLATLSVDFSPALNLVWGPNEAGKSTFQQAILAALYGFYQGNRASTLEKQEHLRFKPWTHAHYGLQLTYALENGRQFQILRNFADDDVPTKVLDAQTGKDLTRQFKVRRHGNISFAAEHTGLSREIFESTVFVRQAEVKSLQNKSGLVNEIISLLDSGTTQTSAEEVIAFLEGQIARVGSDRARIKRLPLAQERLKKLQAEYDALLRARESLHDAVLQKQDMERTLQKDRTKLLQYQYLILDKRILELDQNLKRSEDIRDRLKSLQEKINALKAGEPISDALREGIVRKFQTLDNQKEQIEEIREKIAQQQSVVKGLFNALSEYAGMEKLAEFLSYDEFAALQARWEVAHRAFGNAAREYDEEVKRLRSQNLDVERLQRIYQLSAEDSRALRQQEEDLERLQRDIRNLEWEQKELAQKAPFTKTMRWGFSGLGFVGMVGVFLSLVWGLAPWGAIAGGSLAILAAAGFFIYSQKQKRHSNSLNDLITNLNGLIARKNDLESDYRSRLTDLGVENFRDLLEKRLQFEGLSRKADARQRAREELDSVEFQLLKYLGSIGVQSLSEEELKTIGSQFKSYFGLKEQFDREKRILEEARKDLVRVQDRLELTRESLLERLQEAGIREKDLEKALQQFKKLLEKRKERDRLQREAEKLQSELEGLFSGKSEAEWQQQRQEWQQQRDALVAHHPELKGLSSGWTSQKLLHEYTTLDQRRQELEKQIEGLKATIQTVLTAHRPQAEIEEELAQADRDVRQLLNVRHALEKARTTLRDVMESYHRDLAPMLNQSVGDGLRLVTGERYSDVRIDPETFRVNLVVPETGEVQPSEKLSLGTQEQIYLLLRVAIARVLSENAEPLPLILDDPFVHFDHQRLLNMLEFLTKLSEKNQVILFTKDEDVAAWIKRHVEPERRMILEMNG
ncbi:MAG: AAA family ATPase [Calditrichaeota bacterium]|nr:AAA family ATPase [Calditrichota bacterium]